MRSTRAFFVFLGASLVAAALPASAQTTLGTIRGTVYDPQQRVVPGVTVVVDRRSHQRDARGHHRAQGLYEIPNLRPGTYTVSASLSGFKKTQRTGVVLRPASVALADVQLEVGSLQDVVTVVAEGQNNSPWRARRSHAAWTHSSCATCRATAATSRIS